MTIDSLVSLDYATIDAYQPTSAVRPNMSTAKGIVVTQEGKPIGVLCAADLAAKQYHIVIDCLTEKPVIEITQRISDVLAIMESSGQEMLIVHDNDKFTGVIYQHDILRHLESSLGLQKLKVQSAAHDLKNPLASIQLTVAMLQDSLTQTKDRLLLDYLLQSCGHARKIVDDILLTEQMSENALVAAEEDFDEIVEGCLAHFSIEMKKKHITLEAELRFGSKVMVDRSKLERAIHNLISNAVKFTHEKGSISIHTRRAGNMAQFTIKDSGIGIPASLHRHVFDQFTQARRTGTAGEPPTGLGMYITKQIVELHGGEIKLESDELTGTDVSIFLFAGKP